MDKNVALIADNIKKIQTEGGDDNFVVFEFTPEIYIQFAGHKGDDYILGEAVSNEFLTNNKLDEKQITSLVDLHWNMPDDERTNFHREFFVANDNYRLKLALYVMEIIEKIYRIEPPIEIGIQIQLL
jgi:hypothetical protein